MRGILQLNFASANASFYLSYLEHIIFTVTSSKKKLLEKKKFNQGALRSTVQLKGLTESCDIHVICTVYNLYEPMR